jgi:hypothetical protein
MLIDLGAAEERKIPIQIASFRPAPIEHRKHEARFEGRQNETETDEEPWWGEEPAGKLAAGAFTK